MTGASIDYKEQRSYFWRDIDDCMCTAEQEKDERILRQLLPLLKLLFPSPNNSLNRQMLKINLKKCDKVEECSCPQFMASIAGTVQEGITSI